ncbi:MAG: hypothetical protein Q7U04_04860 [Bacteriovorax sp.]|nr:hypothetical protein [Bacteriovorax sp.]
MRIFTLISILFLISLPILAQNWTGISSCGTYTANGIVRTTDNGIILIVNEKTMSELIISVPIPNEIILAPYVDHSVKVTILFLKKHDPIKLEGTVKEIELRVANSIDPQDTGIKLISKNNCEI